jgi:hypothetical protein
MVTVQDLLEQMTWAINEGGPAAGGKQEVFEFLTNIGRVISANPTYATPPREPRRPYPQELLPLIQQLTWATGERSLPTNIETFLATISWYFKGTGPIIHTGAYLRPKSPPLPQALKSLPLVDLPDLYQIAYWLINEGQANPIAYAFMQAVGYYLFQSAPRTVAGPYRYPTRF